MVYCVYEIGFDTPLYNAYHVEAVFLWGDFLTTKPAKTIEEQLNILKSKGLTINNDNIAKNILFSVNYYVLSGYLFSFKNADGSYDNIDFNKLHKIYQCDKRLKSIILYAIEIIEHNLKTKAAYYMATKTSPLSYMHYAYFVNKEEHEKMLRHFTYNVHNNNRIQVLSLRPNKSTA